jgi:hypothetical protein
MIPFDLETRHKKIKIDFINKGNRLSDIDYKKDYLNINAVNLDLSENVYRIFNWDYFIDDLKNKKLTLVRPNSWQDPFENFLLNSTGQLEDGRLVGLENIRDSFYSLCWSLKADCDGIWRNYKGNSKCAIKAKTTTGKLFDSIYDINNTFHYISYFIGKVDYVSDDIIADFFKDKLDFRNYQGGIEFALTLLLKRLAYAYEEEVRIIVYNKDNVNSLLQIDIDPNLLYDELILDPWIKPIEFEQKKTELINAGFTGKITRSSLYDKPFFIVKL